MQSSLLQFFSKVDMNSFFLVTIMSRMEQRQHLLSEDSEGNPSDLKMSEDTKLAASVIGPPFPPQEQGRELIWLVRVETKNWVFFS